MLTGSQSINGEVGARTIVLEQTRPAHGNTVGFPTGRLDAIVTIRPFARPFQDLGDSGNRTFPPFGNLLLDQHNELG